MKTLLAGTFLITAAAGFVFDLMQLDAPRIGKGFFWPILAGGAGTAVLAGPVVPFLVLEAVVLYVNDHGLAVILAGKDGTGAGQPPIPPTLAAHRCWRAV